MRINPTQTLDAITDLAQKWAAVCPEQSFFGHTLEQFKAGVQPSLDARANLATLDRQSKVELERRHTADQASNYLVQGVVNAIRGDPSQGEDGELYGALGYVRKSNRANGRSRVRANGHTQPPTADTPPKAQEEVKTSNQAA